MDVDFEYPHQHLQLWIDAYFPCFSEVGMTIEENDSVSGTHYIPRFVTDAEGNTLRQIEILMPYVLYRKCQPEEIEPLCSESYEAEFLHRFENINP